MTMYVKEIMNMMHGFGDARSPDPETATLIEEVVRGQMAQLLSKAARAHHLFKNGEGSAVTVGLEELLFLMRRSPVRVQRLIKYFSVRDAISLLDESEDPSAEESSRRRVKRCKNFLEKIDTDGSLCEACDQKLVDDVRAARLQRLDIMSRDLDERKYAEFTKARQASFRSQKFPHKFYQWISKEMSEDGTDIRVNKFGLEILSYLSYETVGQLVDLALTLRIERRDASDPVERQMAPLSLNPHFPMVQIPEPQRESEEAVSDRPVDAYALQPWEIRQVIQRLHHRVQPLDWFYRGERRSIPCPLFVI